MKAFQFGKMKVEPKASACCCKEGKIDPKATNADETTKAVLVLGSGCAKCNALESAAKTALAELGMDIPVGHVTDFAQIAAYGVMATPALVVAGKVVLSGRVPSKDEVKKILAEKLA